MWITEYNLDHQDLKMTQDFYNRSAEYFDRLESVERYSLFGAFRSDVSNVGPNGAMLDSQGRLTDIGAWYLGRAATGIVPDASSCFRSAIPRLSIAVLSATLAAMILF